MNFLLSLALAATLTLGIAGDAFAYIGPGAGLSMIGAFWGLVVAVFAALSFLLLWPLRRMFKKSTPADSPADAPTAPTTHSSTAPDEPAKP
jgi:membrane protein implicated in regulation of membrane protease activity